MHALSSAEPTNKIQFFIYEDENNMSNLHGHQPNTHQHNHPSTTQPHTTVVVTNPEPGVNPNAFFQPHYHGHNPHQQPHHLHQQPHGHQHQAPAPHTHKHSYKF